MVNTQTPIILKQVLENLLFLQEIGYEMPPEALEPPQKISKRPLRFSKASLRFLGGVPSPPPPRGGGVKGAHEPLLNTLARPPITKSVRIRGAPEQEKTKV